MFKLRKIKSHQLSLPELLLIRYRRDLSHHAPDQPSAPKAKKPWRPTAEASRTPSHPGAAPPAHHSSERTH